MKTVFIYLFAISITCLSCNKIKKEDISVIENLTLGKSTDSLYKEMKIKSIPINRFTSSFIVFEKSQIFDDSNYINFYNTNIFNSFANQNGEHCGLLYPITLSGTNNIFGMTVLLGHTKKPLYLSVAKEYEYMNTSKCVIQTINEKLIEDIKKMYSSKYGVPKSDLLSKYNNVFTINNGKVEQYISDEINARTIIWETEFMKITFFTGLKNYIKGCYYKPRDKFYLDIEITGEPIDYSNKMDCYAYPFIKYELNEKSVEELKLKKANNF
jgi:hypothetical protein